MRAIKLIYNEIKIEGVKNILKPKYIYIPIYNENKCLVKKGNYVYKGQVVCTNEDEFNIHSSVSGVVMGRTTYIDSNGNEVRCAVIENDYKELYEQKLVAKKNISKYSKPEFVKVIKEAGIVGLGGAGYPTYLKYQSNDLRCLIINAVECEPLIESDKGLIIQKIEEILEATDAILEINNIPTAIIVVKATNEKIIDVINQYKGTYLNINLHLVTNQYPNGWERKIIKDTLNVKYKKYPSEIGIVVNNVSTIYAMYEGLKYRKPLIEKIVTISGDNINNPSNCLVKIGCSLNEVIPEIGGLKEEGQYLISGGVMTGDPLRSLDVLINKESNAFLGLKLSKEIKRTCLKCGKCANNCPMKLAPVLVKQNMDDIDMLKQLNVDKCINCGLCSYVCPAKIEIREYVKEARKKVG